MDNKQNIPTGTYSIEEINESLSETHKIKNVRDEIDLLLNKSREYNRYEQIVYITLDVERYEKLSEELRGMQRIMDDTKGGASAKLLYKNIPTRISINRGVGLLIDDGYILWEYDGTRWQ